MANESSQPTFNRRQFLGYSSAAVGAATVGGVGAGSTGFWLPAQAATTPTVPSATVSMGAVAYTNHAWTMLANQLGYLKDVGITSKTETPKILLDQQTIPLLQKGETTFQTQFFGIVAQSLDKITNIVPVLIYSYWQGNTILTGPKTPFKTVDDFLAEGMSWDKAAAAAMMQLKGKKLTTQPNPSQIPWLDQAFDFAGIKRQDAELVPVEDPKAVQLGLSNQVDFVAPGGAVQIYQLQFQNNFRSVMSTRQMVKNMPSGIDSKVNNVLNYDTICCTREYLEKNHDTVLRYISVMFRTMETMFGPDQVKTFEKYAPFINANTGAQMNPESIKFIFEELDPFFRWKDQQRVYEDKTYTLQYENLYGYQIKKYIENGTLAKGEYDLDKTFVGKGLWKELVDYQKKSDAFIEKAKTATLSADRKKLFDMGKSYYDKMDYLDSFRFMEAAFA